MIKKEAKLKRKMLKLRRYLRSTFDLYWPIQERNIAYQISSQSSESTEYRKSNLTLDAWSNFLISSIFFILYIFNEWSWYALADLEPTSLAFEQAKTQLKFLIEYYKKDTKTRSGDLITVYKFIGKLITKWRRIVDNPIIKEDSVAAQKSKQWHTEVILKMTSINIELYRDWGSFPLYQGQLVQWGYPPSHLSIPYLLGC